MRVLNVKRRSLHTRAPQVAGTAARRPRGWEVASGRLGGGDTQKETHVGEGSETWKNIREVRHIDPATLSLVRQNVRAETGKRRMESGILNKDG